MSDTYVSLLDKILELAQKSCPERVARQGNLDLWEANRRFVIAGIEFVKTCAKEAATGPHAYRELTPVAIQVYDGLCHSQEAFTEELLRKEADFMDLVAVGREVSEAMSQNIQALYTFDEIDRAHRAAREIPPKWREN